MAPFSPTRPRHPIRVVLSSTALLPFISVRKAAALAIAQLGIAAFFISGDARSTLGESAGWFVVAATALAALARAIDIESWALLLPGGFVSRVTSALGHRTTAIATAAALIERLLLAALASVVAGHYMSDAAVTAIAGLRFTGFVRPEDLATLLAVAAIGVLWIRGRTGREIGPDPMARGIWIGVGLLVLIVVWGITTLALRDGAVIASLASTPPIATITGWSFIDIAITGAVGLALTLPVLGCSPPGCFRRLVECPPQAGTRNTFLRKWAPAF